MKNTPDHKHCWQYPGFEDELTNTRYCKTCGAKKVYERLVDYEPNPWELARLARKRKKEEQSVQGRGGRPKGSTK